MTWRVGVVFHTYRKTLGGVCVQYVCEKCQHRIDGLFPEAAVSVASVVKTPPHPYTKTNTHTKQSLSPPVSQSVSPSLSSTVPHTDHVLT